MSAFRRRTTFATPLVISVAASCSSGGSKDAPPKATPRYPGAVWDVTMQPMGCLARMWIDCPPGGPACNPPPPQEVACPPGSSGKNVVQIAELADKQCAVLPIGCVEPTCATPKVGCPLPPGEKLKVKLAFIWHIEKRGDTCHAEEEEEDCPPGVDCNPPAPRQTMPCPPGASEEKDVLVAELPDGTCAIVAEGCHDTSCIGARTPCPVK